MPEWEALYASDPEATPFMSPIWAGVWWRHLAGSGAPWILTVHDGGELVGVAPFVLRRQGPFRVLQELGSNPNRDVIALPAVRDAAASAIAEELVRRKRDWEALVLRCFPGDSAVERALLASGLPVRTRPATAYPRIELPDRFDDYLASLKKKRRWDLRRHLKRVADGTVAVREAREPAELRAAVDRWRELQLRWWEKKEEEIHAEHRDARFAAFLRDLLIAMVPEELARVWVIERDHAVVGVDINLVDGASVYTWLGGYDPESSDVGPGKIAIAYGIRWAIETGRRYFDFMRGDDPYKYSYGAADRHGQWTMFGNGRPVSKAAVRLAAARERLRRR